MALQSWMHIIGVHTRLQSVCKAASPALIPLEACTHMLLLQRGEAGKANATLQQVHHK